MDGKIVNYSVMDVKIDRRVVIDLSIFEIGGWNNIQPSNKNNGIIPG